MENSIEIDVIDNAKNIKLSEETKKILIALAIFNESFWDVSELLTGKSDGENIQNAFYKIAEEDMKTAREYHSKTFNEIKNLIKEKMFQNFLETQYEEI